MGLDVTAYFGFGTTDKSCLAKIPDAVKRIWNDIGGDALSYEPFDATEFDLADASEIDTVAGFVPLHLFGNGYVEDADLAFEALIDEVDPADVLTYDQSRVRAIFEKYGLPEPQFVVFADWW